MPELPPYVAQQCEEALRDLTGHLQARLGELPYASPGVQSCSIVERSLLVARLASSLVRCHAF